MEIGLLVRETTCEDLHLGGIICCRGWVAEDFGNVVAWNMKFRLMAQRNG